MNWFFDNWIYPARGLVMSFLMFVILLTIVRIGGKRVLTKMNVFDFVFTVAIGSTVASVIMDHETTLLEGIAAVGTLAGLQFLGGWLSSKSPRMDRLINGRPILLLRDGKVLHGAMAEEKISEEEVLCALRLNGVARLEDVAAVVLETDGQFSVIRFRDGARHVDTLADVVVAPGGEQPLDLNSLS